MTVFVTRIDGVERPLPKPVLCDAWTCNGQRFGNELSGIAPADVLGRYPDELETDAVVCLAQTVGEVATWAACATTPPVAQKLAERARPQPLDLEIARHLPHLQIVCHKPRLHLRVEEERLPVSRARSTPVRAVAELVSHPGDWEHRTLRSIQPSRVLARQIEDEWNLYENRVAVRLVDHLLAYLAKRLEELRKIKESLEMSDYSKEILGTSYRRAKRISKLWATTLESKTGEELSRTMRRLEHAQQDLQTLLDSPLYSHVPRREAIALALKPTNILVNDPNYRKVAALWRAWVQFGHKRHETIEQRATRRQREAAAWDRFVLHLVVRSFTSLEWSVSEHGKGWSLSKSGWRSVHVVMCANGTVRITGESTLFLLPLCADLSAADGSAILQQLKALDELQDEVVLVHVGRTALLPDADRASGWSFGRQAVLFACSPWGIDSEERMTRLLHSWLSRSAVATYPWVESIRALPEWTGRRDWLRHEDEHLVAFRPPTEHELAEARAWSSAKARELEADAQRARAAKQAFSSAPREAITKFEKFLDGSCKQLVGLDACPICGAQGRLEARPGKHSDGHDATWWARCSSCNSQWGTRPCACGNRYRVLIVGTPGIVVEDAAHSAPVFDWPDRVLGLEVWAQPCAERPLDHFRCPKCGRCSSGWCPRCSSRSSKSGDTQ